MDTTYFIRGLTRNPVPVISKGRARKKKTGPIPHRIVDLDTWEEWEDAIECGEVLGRPRQAVINACNGFCLQCAGRHLAYVGSPKHLRAAAQAAVGVA